MPRNLNTIFLLCLKASVMIFLFQFHHTSLITRLNQNPINVYKLKQHSDYDNRRRNDGKTGEHHPSPVGHRWRLVGGCCGPVQHTDTQSALPTQVPLPGPAEENEDNGETNEEGDIVQVSMFSDDSESSELSDSD